MDFQATSRNRQETKQQARRRKASCMSARFSYRMRSRRNWLNQAKVRSTTQRHSPSPLPCSVFRFAKKGRTPRHHRPLRIDLIVSAIAYEAVRTTAWTSAFALQRRDGINEYQGLLGVMAIGAGQLDCKRNSSAIADEMTLTALLGSISGIRACLRPPKTARTEQLSTTARDQSILP